MSKLLKTAENASLALSITLPILLLILSAAIFGLNGWTLYLALMGALMTLELYPTKKVFEKFVRTIGKLEDARMPPRYRNFELVYRAAFALGFVFLCARLFYWFLERYGLTPTSAFVRFPSEPYQLAYEILLAGCYFGIGFSLAANSAICYVIYRLASLAYRDVRTYERVSGYIIYPVTALSIGPAFTTVGLETFARVVGQYVGPFTWTQAVTYLSVSAILISILLLPILSARKGILDRRENALAETQRMLDKEKSEIMKFCVDMRKAGKEVGLEDLLNVIVRCQTISFFKDEVREIQSISSFPVGLTFVVRGVSIIEFFTTVMPLVTMFITGKLG